MPFQNEKFNLKNQKESYDRELVIARNCLYLVDEIVIALIFISASVLTFLLIRFIYKSRCLLIFLSLDYHHQ